MPAIFDHLDNFLKASRPPENFVESLYKHGTNQKKASVSIKLSRTLNFYLTTSLLSHATLPITHFRTHNTLSPVWTKSSSKPLLPSSGNLSYWNHWQPWYLLRSCAMPLIDWLIYFTFWHLLIGFLQMYFYFLSWTELKGEPDFCFIFPSWSLVFQCLSVTTASSSISLHPAPRWQ